MAQLLVRRLDDDVKAKLQRRARRQAEVGLDREVAELRGQSARAAEFER